MPVSVRAVRHGQSLANVAFARAEASGILDAGVEKPDTAVLLSELGAEQSGRLGRRIASEPSQLPELVYVSPFLRARQTADLLLHELGPAAEQIPVRVDDRLGDKRTGQLELLTPEAIAAGFPEEFEKLTALGPVGYRPPGGESLWDVADRLRSFWDDLQAAAGGLRVLIVGHDATVLMLRALTEEMTEAQVLELMAHDPVSNATITTWEPVAGQLRLVAWNDGEHLSDQATSPSLLANLPAPVALVSEDDYEAAIDALNRVVGVLAARIQQREHASATELDQLRALQSEYAQRRDRLKPYDSVEIGRVRAEGSRIVRAFDQGIWPDLPA